jgi:ferredoxin-nitrate reductase
MELQLDALGARLLGRAIGRLGVDVRLSARTEAIAGNGRVEAVELAGGESLDADMVVVATGVRPDVALARDAGLEVERGVLVDDSGRTSAAGVWAVGECAEHRGMTYGLWAPLLQQAQVVGAALAGRPAAFHGAVPATTLKVAGVNLFCAGNAAEPADDCEEVIALDSRRARYRKLVLREGRLVGATLLGDLSDARVLRELIADGGGVPDELLDTPATAAGTEDAAPDELLCSCNVVPRADVVAAVRDRALDTVEQVGEHTRAGTGCGGCRPHITTLLERERDRRREPLVGSPPG